MRGLGPNQQKIILLLLTGLALGMNTSPSRGYRLIDSVVKDWKRINALNKRSFERSLRLLEKKKLVSFKKKGKIFFPTLTARGRRQAFFAELQQMTIPIPKAWDGRWRVVLFDIPEDERKIRNYLRQHLKRMCFLSLQESVFVHPFDCEKEIRRLSEYYGNGTYIRFIEAIRIDQEKEVRAHFGLS